MLEKLLPREDAKRNSQRSSQKGQLLKGHFVQRKQISQLRYPEQQRRREIEEVPIEHRKWNAEIARMILAFLKSTEIWRPSGFSFQLTFPDSCTTLALPAWRRTTRHY